MSFWIASGIFVLSRKVRMRASFEELKGLAMLIVRGIKIAKRIRSRSMFISRIWMSWRFTASLRISSQLFIFVFREHFIEILEHRSTC
jgi:hypothetical protein